jgi:2-amino-4-hydroxy-6-hydroxymethyldihydropteridine diphosphokinase
MDVERVAIALGSNLGDRSGALERARAEIARPLGPVEQGPFLNQMLLVETGLEPRALLEGLLAIERALGRVRGKRWGPRILDCDIVLFGARTVRESDLTIPHPELPRRDFWRRELEALDVHLPVG